MKILFQEGDRIEISQNVKLEDKETERYSTDYYCTVYEKVDDQCYKEVLKDVNAVAVFENALNMKMFGAREFVRFAMLKEDLFANGASNTITVEKVKKDGTPVFEIYGELYTASEALEEYDKRTGIDIHNTY